MKRETALSAVVALGMAFSTAFSAHAAGAAKKYEAVVATVAADYSSGAHSVASVEQVKKKGVMKRPIKNNLAPTISDITVAAYGKHFYRLERYNSDSIAKFSFKKPQSPVWQFSIMDSGETASSNPHDMVFASEEKAYVLRYGSTKAWIVNPGVSKKKKSAFKLGELDLSAYADSDGVPEMHCGVIVNGKLFVVMQRLDSDHGWTPSNTAYLAVFDVETNEEIDTGKGSDGLKGIPLPVRGPQGIGFLAASNTVYVQGVGAWPGYGDAQYEYTGGIAAVDPDTYEARMALDDGSSDDHPYGAVSGMALVSPESGYFVGYEGWGDNVLYRFNPTTGEVLGEVGEGLSHVNIAGWDTQAGAPDRSGKLWVCDSTNAKVLILNTDTHVVEEKLDTNLNPAKAAFAAP